MGKQNIEAGSEAGSIRGACEASSWTGPAWPAPGEAGHRGVDCAWERDATIAAAEQRASAGLQAMITDESLTVSEAVQWCAGAISHREAARHRQLTAQAHNND
jgi:hypothetical protein